MKIIIPKTLKRFTHSSENLYTFIFKSSHKSISHVVRQSENLITSSLTESSLKLRMKKDFSQRGILFQLYLKRGTVAIYILVVRLSTKEEKKKLKIKIVAFNLEEKK